MIIITPSNWYTAKMFEYNDRSLFSREYGNTRLYYIVSLVAVIAGPGDGKPHFTIKVPVKHNKEEFFFHICTREGVQVWRYVFMNQKLNSWDMYLLSIRSVVQTIT